jgi:hypothetical protein
MTRHRLIYEPEYLEVANEMFRAKAEKGRAKTELEGLEGSVEMEACMACVDPARVVQAAYWAVRLEQEATPQLSKHPAPPRQRWPANNMLPIHCRSTRYRQPLK